MIEQGFSVIEKLLFEFSWRRFLSLVLLLSILLGGFTAFEWYTSYFAIARIQRTAAVLAALQQVENATGDQNPNSKKVCADLIVQLNDTMYDRRVSITTGPLDLTFSWKSTLKFLLGASPWLLFSVAALPAIRRKEPNAWYGVAGMFIFATIFGGIGMALPTVAWPWINLVVYPVAHFVLILAGFTVLAFKMSKRAKKPATADS